MLSVSKITGNGAVFQRGQPHVISGSSTFSKKLVSAWHDGMKIGETTSSLGGQFTLYTSELPVGGPYQIQVTCEGYTEEICDIFVGDVWMIAGQSNAYKPANVNLGASVRAFGSVQPKMRPIYPENDPPLVYVREDWHRSGYISRLGAVFANGLNSATGIPIGILKCAYPGALIQKLYNSDGYSQQYGSTSSFIKQAPSDALAMDWVYPFAGTPMKGVIWWQGESNIPAHEHYAGHLTRLMARWRLIFNRPDLYFTVIGLQNIIYDSAYYLPEDQAQLRTAQRAVADADENAVWVKTEDLTPTGEIHPPDDEVNAIAQRVANAVRTRLYV